MFKNTFCLTVGRLFSTSGLMANTIQGTLSHFKCSSERKIKTVNQSFGQNYHCLRERLKFIETLKYAPRRSVNFLAIEHVMQHIFCR